MIPRGNPARERVTLASATMMRADKDERSKVRVALARGVMGDDNNDDDKGKGGSGKAKIVMARAMVIVLVVSVAVMTTRARELSISADRLSHSLLILCTHQIHGIVHWQGS